MADDLWYQRKKDAAGNRLPAKRHGRGKRWRIRWVDPATGRKREELYEKKCEAERAAAERAASIVTGQYVDPKAGRVTLRQYAAQWESTNVGSAAQARITDNALRVHVLPVLGDRPLATIRRSDVQGMVKGLVDKLAPNTIRAVYDVLGRVLAAAVDDRLITSTPCRKIALPAVPDVEVVPPTVEHVRALADAVPARYRAAVVLLAGSGLRIGELLGLRVADVDFLRRTVRVERQRLQSGRIAPPKTARSTRTVPLGRVVIDELAAHLAAFPSGEWLFTDDEHRPVTYRSWKQVWALGHARLQAAQDKAAAGQGHEPATVPRATTHDLRHFFASALIAGGASVKQVQTVLGHSSATVTLQTYAHLWPGDEDRTRSIVDLVLHAVSADSELSCAGSVPGNRGAAPAAGQTG